MGLLGVFNVIAFLLTSYFVHAQDSVQAFDPLNDYCRRFGHQTTVVGNKLLIDGGYVQTGGYVSPSTQNITNTYLLYLDLDTLENNFPVEYANLSKPAYVPSTIGGALWADNVNKFAYLFGGETNWTTPPPSQFTLWQYDVLYDKWAAKTTDNSVSSVSYGASTVVDDRALAFYYGGWLSNATVLGWNGNAVAQPGLVVYDMINDDWQNNTFYDGVPRAEGVMFYIPASDAGMLVYFGGVQQMSNGSYAGVPMNQIYIYDIGGQNGYMQTTTGNAPPARRRFCGGVSWAEDQSSYNIYFYGGMAPDAQGFGYGDVWILSIPSFTWTQASQSISSRKVGTNGKQWYPSSNAHHSLTCNVVDDGQMIIMGGAFPNSSNTDCDVKDVWGQHNLNLGADDVANSEWWVFEPNITTYQVPQVLHAAIGGGATGGATVTAPAHGYQTSDLGVLITRKYTASTRTATRNVSTATTTSTSASAKSSLNVGAVAGGAVGGVVVLAAIVGLALFCMRRRHKKRQALGGVEKPNGQNEPLHPVTSQVSQRNISGPSEMAVASPRAVSGPSELGGASPHVPHAKVAHSPEVDGNSPWHTPAASPPPQFTPYNAPWPHQFGPHYNPHGGHGTNWSPVPVYYVPTQHQPPGYHPHPQQFYQAPPGSQHGHASPSYEMPSAHSPTYSERAPAENSKDSPQELGVERRDE